MTRMVMVAGLLAVVTACSDSGGSNPMPDDARGARGDSGRPQPDARMLPQPDASTRPDAGTDGGDGMVKASARFIMGASPNATKLSRPAIGADADAGVDVPLDGVWLLTPTRARFNFGGIGFKVPDGSDPSDVPLEDCNVEYDSSRPTGAVLLDCPFSFEPGIYHAINAAVGSSEMQVMISDDVNGFYTTATGISATEPAGGAEFLSIDVGSISGISGTVGQEIEVKVGEPFTLYVVVDMLLTFHIEVQGGEPSIPDNVQSPVRVLSTPFAGGSSALYTASGTSLNHLDDMNEHNVRVLYSKPGVPAVVEAAVGGAEECDSRAVSASPEQSWGGQGYYLGVDDSGTMGWVSGSTDAFVSYSTMDLKTGVGDTTTFRCEVTSTPMLPSSGNTYASGAPEIKAPTVERQLTLVGN